MNNFIYENSTKTYFGKGCVKEYLTCLTRHYGKNVMFAYDGDFIRNNGIYDEITERLTKAGKNIITFTDIMENPTYEKVLEGAKMAREYKIDFILAVGGSCVMDCCKAVSMAAVYKGDLWNDFFARPGIMEFDPIPLGVVVAKTETGSEMNGRAIITNRTLKVRMGRDYPKCNPRFALIDPVYSCNVSKRQMISDGFNTLSYIMEIYFSKPDEDNISDDMAEALMRSVIRKGSHHKSAGLYSQKQSAVERGYGAESYPEIGKTDGFSVSLYGVAACRLYGLRSGRGTCRSSSGLLSPYIPERP